MIFKQLRLGLKLLLIVTLMVGGIQEELEARKSGGRVGGGSIRTDPSRSPRGAPSTTGSPSIGGGSSFPFLLPLFFTGGGGIFGFIMLLTILNYVINATRSQSSDGYVPNTPVTVAQLQVGLLAIARDLQPTLNQIAREADTSTGIGRSKVIQEVSLALLRHPEYWAYAATEVKEGNHESAETQFNRLVLEQRSKFNEETLVNLNNQLTEKTSVDSGDTQAQEYILITIIVGVEGKLALAEINGQSDLHQALQQIGSVPSDRLLAFEVLWTPQAVDDSLTRDDLMEHYPNLKLV